jgi:membrane AbrB-like protein
MSRAQLLATVLTMLAGLAGGLAFLVAGLPAAWLSGPMVGIAIAMGFGLRPALPDPLRDLGMLFAGIVMGSAITPEMIAALARYPGSLALLVLTTVAIAIAGQALLMRVWRWDADSGLFASLPGAMSAVLATAASAGVDMGRVAVMQSFRLFILAALLPSAVVASVGGKAIAAGTALSLPGFIAVMASGLVLALIFDRLKIIAGFMLGGMVAAGVLHVTSLVPGAAPPVFVDLSMFLIGLFVGSRFANLTLGGLRALLLPGLALFLVTTLIALIGAVLTWQLVGSPLPEALVAFAPGGLEAMVVLGLALGLDPLYVSSHHIARFLLISIGLPLIARWVLKGVPPR